MLFRNNPSLYFSATLRLTENAAITNSANIYTQTQMHCGICFLARLHGNHF